MNRSITGLAFGALILVVVVTGGQGVTASGASSPAPPSGRAQGIAAEQSRAASAGQALGLGGREKLVVKDVLNDPDGSTHVRYDRTFNGLRAVGGDLVSHRDKSGRVKSVSSSAPHNLEVASTPRLSLASARAAGAKKATLTQETTSASKGELVVYAGGATPKLAYDVRTDGVRADQTPSRLHTIVDANSGAMLASWDEIKNGTGNGIYVRSVPIGTTADAAGGSFSMRDSVGNYTTDLKGLGDGTGIDIGTVPGTTFADADDRWGNALVTDRASAGVDAHYGAGKTFEYYNSVLGRRGISNTGVGARSRVHYGNGYVNAFWDGTQVTYGDGVGNGRPLVELDVAGHEMTHGVTERTAGLVGDGEAGGLNEATSDIFGTSVEWFANIPADRPDYLIGELVNANGNGTPLRYMDRPLRDGVSPNCWSPSLGGLDSHFSSGPLNHWFYLASEGSGAKVINGVSYDSPTCNASTVTGVGRVEASKIWYRTLSMYLTSNSGYAAAREGAIQSAKDLYGDRPAVCAGIAAAFSAIAVPPGAQTCGGTPAPPLGGNLLRNPGFESGNILWSASSNVVAQNGANKPARSGTWNAWMGGFGVTHTESISQLLNIPAGRSATFSYHVRVDTNEVRGSPAFDTMRVRAGSTTLQTLSNRDAASGYQLKTVGLSAYAGRTILLALTGVENRSLQTSFVVDDMAVTTTPPGARRIIFSPLDFSGDGKSDVLRVTSTGDLLLYQGSGTGGFKDLRKIGTGWGFVNVLSPGDFTGDGKADILAVRSNGDLSLARGNGLGGFAGSGTKVGTGWGVFSTVFSPGDFTGDGKSDVMGVNRATGGLYLFRGNGAGGWLGAGTKIGSGWLNMKVVFSPRDFTGDGKSDVMGVNRATGGLYLYRGNGRGGWLGAGTKIGNGWGGLAAVFSPADFTGDRKSDVMGVTPTGDLYLYRGNASGGWLGSSQRIASLN